MTKRKKIAQIKRSKIARIKESINTRKKGVGLSGQKKMEKKREKLGRELGEKPGKELRREKSILSRPFWVVWQKIAFFSATSLFAIHFRHCFSFLSHLSFSLISPTSSLLSLSAAIVSSILARLPQSRSIHLISQILVLY